MYNSYIMVNKAGILIVGLVLLSTAKLSYAVDNARYIPTLNPLLGSIPKPTLVLSEPSDYQKHLINVCINPLEDTSLYLKYLSESSVFSAMHLHFRKTVKLLPKQTEEAVFSYEKISMAHAFIKTVEQTYVDLIDATRPETRVRDDVLTKLIKSGMPSGPLVFDPLSKRDMYKRCLAAAKIDTLGGRIPLLSQYPNTIMSDIERRGREREFAVCTFYHYTRIKNPYDVGHYTSRVSNVCNRERN